MNCASSCTLDFRGQNQKIQIYFHYRLKYQLHFAVFKLLFINKKKLQSHPIQCLLQIIQGKFAIARIKNAGPGKITYSAILKPARPEQERGLNHGYKFDVISCN